MEKQGSNRRWIFSGPPLAPLPVPQLETCGVSVRFGMAEVLGLMVLYALVFSVLSLLKSSWYVFLAVGLFMAGVAVAQALLYSGRRPRLASALGGAILLGVGLPLALAILEVVSDLRAGRFQPEWLFMLVVRLPFFCIRCAPLGLVAGYAAGTLMAGAFLVVRMLTGELRLKPEIVLRAMVPEDCHTLEGWLEQIDQKKWLQPPTDSISEVSAPAAQVHSAENRPWWDMQRFI